MENKELQEQTEVTIMSGICHIQAIADIMRAFYPENDREFNLKSMPDLMRRCGESIRVITDKLLQDLDL